MFGFNRQKRLDVKLADAASAGNIREIAALLDAGANIEMKKASRWGDTPLGVAAHKGHLPAVKLLLDRGADIEAKDQTGLTPLVNAIYNGHADVIVELLNRGADKYMQNDRGLNAVDAAKKKNARIRGLLGIKDEAPPVNLAVAADPDEVTLKRKLGDKVLEEVFNFSARERISLLRAGLEGPVEAMTRESFDALGERVLRRAFDEYAGAGGKIPEAEVFPASIAKVKPQPRAQ